MVSQPGMVRRLPAEATKHPALVPPQRPPALKAESLRADRARNPGAAAERNETFRLRRAAAAEQICDGLWQCRVDQVAALVQQTRPDVVVNLTDKFFTPQPGVMTITWPIADKGLPDIRMLEDLAVNISHDLAEKRAVVVCCEMGVNRSSLLTALVYRAVVRVSGHMAMLHVRRLRPTSLTNEAFAAYLEKLGAP